MLHLFSRLAVLAALLIVAGGRVIGARATGGSVPGDGYRLSTDAMVAVVAILAIGLWRAEPRRWVARLGIAALGAAIALGILSRFTPGVVPSVSLATAHVALTQLVFCLTLAIATVTSRGWHQGYQRMTGAAREGDRLLAALATLTAVAVSAQFLFSAWVRDGASLAVPDFPLTSGPLVPPHWDARTVAHAAHRIGALAVAALTLATIGHVLAHHRRRPDLRNPSLLLIAALSAQLALDAFVVGTPGPSAANVAQAVTGALVLAAALVLALRTHRLFGTQALASGSNRVRTTTVGHLGARA